MQFDEIPDDGEAESEAAVLAGEPAVGLPETLEQVRHKFRVDPLPVVLHYELGELVASFRREPHVTAACGELHGVRQQVPHDLLETIRIPGNDRKVWLDLDLKRDALRVGGWLHRGHGVMQDVVEIDGTD